MQTNIPTTSQALTALLRADFTTQWRNRRSLIIILLVPVIITLSWKGVVDKLGGAFVLASGVTIGLNAIGLMGYCNSIARDRDKGVFQRLRVAPVPTWCIMISRLIVQLAMILLLTTIVFIAGHYFDKITLSPSGYALGFLSALVGGAVYLGLGQAIVGRVKNVETVNAVSRFTYFIFIMVGMFGELGMLGDKIGKAVKWSPYGTVKHLLLNSLQPANWSQQTSISLLVTIGYAIVFSALGIKWFQWNAK